MIQKNMFSIVVLIVGGSLVGCGYGSGSRNDCNGSECEETCIDQGHSAGLCQGEDCVCFDYDRDADDDIDEDGDIETIDPEDVPHCGDGVIDEGEECDDGNRLNGDTCDWLCQLGEGEPPPDPDPTAEEYVPSGDPEPADDTVIIGYTQNRFSLTWSGEQFAAAYSTEDDIRFHRFDASGHRVDTDWTSPIISRGTPLYAELVWNGDGYGLFYNDGSESNNLYFLRLDAEGKPLGDPLIIAEQAYYPSADLAPDGYAISWTSCDEVGNCTINFSLIGQDGLSDGFPASLELAEFMPETVGYLDVASGPSGYGVSLSGSEERIVRILWINEDLTEVQSSGILSHGYPGEIKWTGESYVTAWNVLDPDVSHDTYLGTCVARYSANGILERAPICSDFGAQAGVLIAASTNSLALVFRSGLSDHMLSFITTDRFGVPVGDRYNFTDTDPDEYIRVESAGTVRVDDGFAVAFCMEGGTLMLQRFVLDV